MSENVDQHLRINGLLEHQGVTDATGSQPPAVKKTTGTETLHDGANAFTYVRGEPVNRIDRNGLGSSDPKVAFFEAMMNWSTSRMYLAYL